MQGGPQALHHPHRASRFTTSDLCFFLRHRRSLFSAEPLSSSHLIWSSLVPGRLLAQTLSLPPLCSSVKGST